MISNFYAYEISSKELLTMGYELKEYLKKATSKDVAPEKPALTSSEYLIKLYGKINNLPTQYDIKGLLQKCVYSILTDENLEEEIQFLCEIKKLLNQIRVSCNFDHLEIIGVINEIYCLAVDKKLEEDLREDEDSKVIVDEEILALFENNYAIFEDGDLVVEEQEEEQGEDQNDNEQEEEEDKEDYDEDRNSLFDSN